MIADLQLWNQMAAGVLQSDVEGRHNVGLMHLRCEVGVVSQQLPQGVGRICCECIVGLLKEYSKALEDLEGVADGEGGGIERGPGPGELPDGAEGAAVGGGILGGQQVEQPGLGSRLPEAPRVLICIIIPDMPSALNSCDHFRNRVSMPKVEQPGGWEAGSWKRSRYSSASPYTHAISMAKRISKSVRIM